MKQTIFFAILALASVYFFIYYYNNQDISYVKIEGYVLDSINSQPLRNVKVTVTNDRYENDNGHRNYDDTEVSKKLISIGIVRLAKDY